MKFETHAEYDPRQSEMVKRAFLSVWSSFTRWHDDLVLLGGLVPKFICKPLPDEAFRRTQIRQQMVDVAAALRRVL